MLLKPDGPLSVMPMSFIESVMKVISTTSCLTEDDEIDNCEWRGTHQHFYQQRKVKIE